MNKTSVPQQVDICEVVFEVAQFQIADAADDYNELMKKLQRILDADTFNELDQISNYRVYKAQQAGFKIGWAMRGQV